MRNMSLDMRRTVNTVKAAGACALVSLSTSAAAPSVADAAVRDCPQSTFTRARLGAVASILSVRSMSCRGALGFVRRYGATVRTGGVGSAFRLGPFRCAVYYVNEEDNKARCTNGTHAFRVDYGS